MHFSFFKKKCFLLSLLIGFGASTNIHAILAIDIEGFGFKDQRKGIKIIQFDTETQKFKRISYSTFTGTKTRPVDSSFNYNDIPGLTIHSSGNVKITSKFDLTKFMVRTMGTITYPPTLVDSFHWTDFESHSVLQAKTGLLSGNQVVKKLTKYSGGKKGGSDFNISWNSINHAGVITPCNSTTFSNISSDREENNKERGRLGEVATLLSMADFGYMPLSSKYENNHGFDGVFKTRNGKTLFITESKCRNESKNAAHYLQHALSEEKLYETLKTMRASIRAVKESAEEIGRLIQSNPKAIFKFAHRIKPDGTSQCALKGFSLDKYNKSLPPVVRDYTTEAHRVDLMRETCSAIGASLEKTLIALMMANDPSLTGIKNMLKKPEFQDITQKP